MLIVWINLVIMLSIMVVFFCLLRRKSKAYPSISSTETDHQEEQTTVGLQEAKEDRTAVGLQGVKEDQTEKRPHVESQTVIRHSKNQVDIRQEQNEIEAKYQSEHQTGPKYPEENKTREKCLEDITEIRYRGQTKRCHQEQESEIDSPGKQKTKKYQQEDHQFETDYCQVKTYIQKHTTKINFPEHQSATACQEYPTRKYSQRDATKICHQEDQIKTCPSKQESKTDYQEKSISKKCSKRKERKTSHQVHQAKTDNQEAQTKISSEEEPFREDNHPNLDFYRNIRKSEPNGDYIENILEKWFGDYEKLEYHHGYIQWLFPNRVAGLNRKAFCLSDYEIQKISKDEVLIGRVKKSFRLMLDFYGMSMNDDCQFNLSRLDDPRIKNLKESYHNFLRITRILTTLGEFGLRNEQENWLDFLKDKVRTGVLKEAKYSLENFWIPAVQNFQNN